MFLFLLFLDRNCQPDAGLYESGCNSYALFIAEVAAHNNISDHCKLYGGNITYIGNLNKSENVREIPTQKWSQCVRDYSKNTTYVSHYYYSTPGTYSPMNDTLPVPLRFETTMIEGRKKI